MQLSWPLHLPSSPKNFRIMWAQHLHRSRHSSDWVWSSAQWLVACCIPSVAISCHSSHLDCCCSQRHSSLCAFCPNTTMHAKRDIRIVGSIRLESLCATITTNSLFNLLFSRSFDPIITESSRCTCVCNEHYGNECLDWFPRRHTRAAFETIRSWTNSTWWVIRQGRCNPLDTNFLILVLFRCCVHYQRRFLRTDSTHLGMYGRQVFESKSLGTHRQLVDYSRFLSDWTGIIHPDWTVSCLFDDIYEI